MPVVLNNFNSKDKILYFRKMTLLRKILFPFAVLFGIITDIRNFLYDRQILKSTVFDIPVIAVGNLNVGGTGKSPQIEYLIRLLSPKYTVATLSRGYKRTSEGFIQADETSTASTLGDEPFQFHRKFQNILVAVDADRRNGIEQLLKQHPKPDIILLDDAFQHRKVSAGFYILLTAYGDLYSDDFMLPTGNLREGRNGAKRADVVVVTKCPKDLSANEQTYIRKKLKLNKVQQLAFSYIDYDEKVYGEGDAVPTAEIKGEPKVLLAGIAKPKPFFSYLQHEGDMILEFPDHHAFTDAEISEIREKAKDLKLEGGSPLDFTHSDSARILTTEKDYVRLKKHVLENLYYLPIKSSFISGSENFDSIILNFVGNTMQ